MRARRMIGLVVALGVLTVVAPAAWAADTSNPEQTAIDQTPPRLSLTSGQVSFWRPGAQEWPEAQRAPLRSRRVQSSTCLIECLMSTSDPLTGDVTHDREARPVVRIIITILRWARAPRWPTLAHRGTRRETARAAKTST